MTSARLVLQSVSFYRRTHLPVAIGVASAVAVLAGALLVGSSVRTSLVAIAASRLGRADFVIMAERPFGAGLGGRISKGSVPGERGQTPADLPL